MRIYAMSDIHGCDKALRARLGQLQSLGFMDESCTDELVLLGDYIDRGPHSLEVLSIAMRLCNRCPGRVHALAGNHEEEMLSWLGVDGTYDFEDDLWQDDDWPGEYEPMDELPHELLDQRMNLEARMLAWRMADWGALTMRSLLGPTNWRAIGPALRRGSTMVDAFAEACECIRMERSAQIEWVRKLEAVYETERQIYVHAGIDESLGVDWRMGTPRAHMLNDRSCRRGLFAKDVIAGHTPTEDICGDPQFHDVLWDGSSHFYIDGATPSSNSLPLLVWDSDDGSYQALGEDGSTRAPRLWIS